MTAICAFLPLDRNRRADGLRPKAMYPARRVPSFILHGCRFGAPDRFRTCDSAFGAAGWPDRCLRDIAASSPNSEERTGVRFEKERVCGYSGGAKALPGRPFAPAIAPIRGSRR
jgi:hypothetical protein